MKTYHNMILFNKQTDMIFQDNIIGTTQRNRKSKNTKHQWIPPNWHKWNGEAPGID